MGRLDTWHPNEGGLSDDEVEAAVVTLGPAELAIQRRMDDLANAESYSRVTDRQGKCNFCGHITTREFCGGKCETKAAFATIGKSLKFHGDT